MVGSFWACVHQLAQTPRLNFDVVIGPDDPLATISKCIRHGEVIGHTVSQVLGHFDDADEGVSLKSHSNTAITTCIVHKVYTDI